MRRIIINPDKCKGCELCIQVCPHDLLRKSKKPNEKGYQPVFLTDTDSCTGCGFCALVCPDIAIEVYRVEEKKKNRLSKNRQR